MSAAQSIAQSPTASGLDVESVRADFPALRQTVRGKPLVYLDNAATSQKPQCVVDTVANYYGEDCANVHRGAHRLSERAAPSAIPRERR